MDYLNELWSGIPLTQLLISLGIVAGGTLIGLVFEKVGLKRIYHTVLQTKWNGDDIIIYALRHIVTIWFALAALIILQSLGVRITPLLAALGVGGLAVALALQETLANLFAGIVIILSRQLRPNDFVQLSSGEQGYVEDISWRNTTIRSLANNMIIVPNAELSSTIVTNYYQPEPQMSLLLTLGVSYASDLEHVERVTVEVATEVVTEIEGGIPDEEPFIRFNNFGDFSIDFTVIMQTTEVVNQYLMMHEFIKRLHKRYGEEGIEIPFPIRSIQSMDDSNGAADPLPTDQS
ncbi:hypothetical protein BH24ACT22_BH24ACT22_09470 [soil metagenome]